MRIEFLQMITAVLGLREPVLLQLAISILDSPNVETNFLGSVHGSPAWLALVLISV